ncbi:hypothetical protein PGT21_020584 [Puccinia graminis f. sp. tritici]|uniref:Uncharacterized protein n=1 Tax=Puccinia graminis f. sp. tritici TaxID=56615 RepID=A0A5B0NJN3_PUCGR|nr:hypothetical protein PGT21_020584 [Puccinia graminis f. sp. tritici]
MGSGAHGLPTPQQVSGRVWTGKGGEFPKCDPPHEDPPNSWAGLGQASWRCHKDRKNHR